jgi:POT family proton-dependent oligopeptide transporter
MAFGSLIVGLAYLLLAAVAMLSGAALTGWAWLALFFLILTFGELFILPTGLGLFARLAPPHLGATTVAAWFLVIFSGSLSAGLIGTLWSKFEPAPYFLLLAGIAGLAAILLRGISAVANSEQGETISAKSD